MGRADAYAERGCHFADTDRVKICCADMVGWTEEDTAPVLHCRLLCLLVNSCNSRVLRVLGVVLALGLSLLMHAQYENLPSLGSLTGLM